MLQTDIIFCKCLKISVENEGVCEPVAVSQKQTNGFGHVTPMFHTEWLAATFAPMIALVITIKNVVEALSSFSHLPHGLMGFVLETLKGNLLLTHPYFSDR